MICTECKHPATPRRLEGARAAFKVVRAAFIEYLVDHENSDAFTPEQKKAVISALSDVLTSVKRNCAKLEQAMVADNEDGIDAWPKPKSIGPVN